MIKKFDLIFYEKFNEELKNYWLNLENKANISPFQTYKWQEYWSNQCGKNNKIIIVLVFKNKELISILPLNIKKFFFFKVLNWNGFPFSDYNSPIERNDIYLNEQDYNLIFSSIKKNYKFDVLHLINNNNKYFLIGNNFISNKSYKLKILDNINYKKIFDKFKKKIVYEEKRLLKNNNLEIILNPIEKERKEITDFFINEKFKQLDKTGAWNYLRVQNYKNYITNLNSLNEDLVNYSCLKLNKKIIAGHIGYKFRQQFFYIFPVYDKLFKKFSPGNILLFKLIEFYKNKDIKYFDLTIGNEDYKKKISNSDINIYEIVKSFNVLGLIYENIIKFKYFIKKSFIY